MTDGFERKDMNTNDSEQVQSFSTADNAQQATGAFANTEAQASNTSGAANNTNSGYKDTSYSSNYNAQQNAYNSYYRYAGNMNDAQQGMNGMNNGQNNVHVVPDGGKAPKKKGGSKGALVAGIVAIALVVGGGAGFAGTVLGNSINATIPFANSSEGTSQGESTDSGSESTIAAPSTTLNTSNTATPLPLPYFIGSA